MPRHDSYARIAKKETAMTNTPQMTAQQLLDQILGQGRDLVAKAKTADTAELTARGKDMFKQAEDALADKLGVGDDAESRKKLRLGSAAAAGGLALILGNRSNRKFAGLAGLGALGYIAYKAQKAGAMPRNLDDVMALINDKAPANRADVLLQAMVSAAQADGELSNEELALLDGLEGVESGDVETVLAQTANPVAIAKLAKDDQMALEIYAASCRVANGLNPRERDYLDRLAMEMRLDPEIAAQVETDVRTG
jgi:uncharacterized membrane protein YebE (DUF533 family)